MDDTDRSDDDTGEGFGISLGGGLRKLVDLLERVDRSGRESGEGRVPGRTAIDYSYAARTVDADRDDERSRDGDRAASRPRTVRRVRSARVPVRVDRDGDDVVIVVDVEDVDREDLTVGVDRSAGELVVGVADTPTGRVPIDGDGAAIVDVTENNRILEVRVRPREGDDE